MKLQLLFLVIAFGVLSGCTHVEPLCVVRSGNLRMKVDLKTGLIDQLVDVDSGLSWRADGTKVFQLDPSGQQLKTRLTARPGAVGEIVLTLSIHNPSKSLVNTGVHFPQLDQLEGGGIDSLHYCYPRQGLIVDRKLTQLEDVYSSRFPLQFVSAYQPGKGGVYVMTCDTGMMPKQYRLAKDRQLSMGAYYPRLAIEPGQTIELPPARVGVYSGDWHDAFDAYKRWTRRWYKPTSPRKQWFSEVFHFRQVFLYPNLDTPGLYDDKTQTLSIKDEISRDRERFGSVDFVHLFDWSQTPDQGRVGVYQPWHHLPRGELNREIESLEASGTPVGLYFEGYLVSPIAKVPGRPGRAWQLANQQAGRYDPFGSGDDYLCPGVLPWREYLVDAVDRVSNETLAKGFYIDQFGFGYQYPCYDPSHGHAIPSNQVRAEAKFIEGLRKKLSDRQVLYTEQTPVDVAMQYQDASFSYSLLHARNPQCPTRINLTRFAFPDFKTIQILKGDGPIGEDVQGVELVFYNGDGLWLVGPSANPKWYSQPVLQAIRKTQAIRERYMEAFTCEDITPLVSTRVADVYANRFRSQRYTVWTLYNASDEAVDAAVLRLRHQPGAIYHDAWNQIELTPMIEDGWATLFLRLAPGGVGCVVKSTE